MVEAADNGVEGFDERTGDAVLAEVEDLFLGVDQIAGKALAANRDLSIAAVSARRPLRTIGVAFSVSEVAEVPHQDHDQRLDAVLTEREWIDCRGE